MPAAGDFLAGRTFLARCAGFCCEVRFGCRICLADTVESVCRARPVAGYGSVRRFGSRQETLVDISYRSAGCPCKGRCRLPRAMTLRANFRAGQRSRRIRLLVLSLCSTTGAEYPNGSYSAAASDALCPTSVTMSEWAIRGRKSVRPRYPLAHGRLRFLFVRVGPELAVAFRREILTFRPSGAGLLPFRDRTLARGPFQRAERLDIPARFFTFAR